MPIPRPALGFACASAFRHRDCTLNGRALPLLLAGKVIFPAQYPYKPPSILMLTPSGRFAVNTKLCLRCGGVASGAAATRTAGRSRK